MSPYPTAWTELISEGKEPQMVKIYRSEVIPSANTVVPGTILTDNKTYLHVACSNSLISVEEIQFAGKKAMKVDEVLRGYKIEEGAYFK